MEQRFHKKASHAFPPQAPGEFMARIVDRNIEALMKRRCDEEKTKSTQDRIADAITRFTGSMRFVYIHLCLFGTWIMVNLPWSPDWLRFDPTYVVLAMFASVETIFLSTFVLISQNRMQAMADKRADLDLQVSLLAEHEVTRMLTLVKAIGKKVGIDESHDPELRELEQDVRPEKVLDRLEENEQRNQ